MTANANPAATARMLVLAAVLASPGLAACTGDTDRAELSIAAPPLAPEAIPALDWANPANARIMMSEFAFAPRLPVFVQGQPTRLELTNAGAVPHVFSAPEFFRAVSIRSVVTGPARRPVRPAGWPDAALQELTLRTVTDVLAMTPHELELARESTNPFNAPPTEATPIDFGDLLGDLPLGAFDLGAPADAPAVPPAASDAAALPALPPADGAPLNPFAIPDADAAAAPAAPPEPAPANVETPAPEPVVADLADAEPPMPEPDAITEADEAQLLAQWGGADPFAEMNFVQIPPNTSVWITMVPVRTGTFALANLRPFALLGMSGTITVIPRSMVPPLAEIAYPVANLTFLAREAREDAKEPDSAVAP